MPLAAANADLQAQCALCPVSQRTCGRSLAIAICFMLDKTAYVPVANGAALDAQY